MFTVSARLIVVVAAIRFRTLLSAETRACLDWGEGCIAEDDGVVKRDSSSAV